ncbi:bifunctional transcriptional activator/DNA repair enzyme Ada [Coccinella septempunctata]|uniref:bifunctional transcriptional activator/DNA repair enzyme Ada n=1 Tax=Coccinella septempunctata TaxID=41139 RepID=UPI001D0756B7|nr:bifunctional transcriptional activator/DNA repair enzyme Ada [Coccinella septempunctata]
MRKQKRYLQNSEKMVQVNILEDAEESKNLIYGVGECEFGFLFLLVDESEKIYYSSFPPDKNATSELIEIKKYWPEAEFSEDADKISKMVSRIFSRGDSLKFDVMLKGTEFQVSVWKAIANVKEGSTVYYEEIAKAIGNPKAVRAVASAVKNNKLAYLIPCHRVISKTGGMSKYKWGGDRKVKLLDYEKTPL